MYTHTHTHIHVHVHTYRYNAFGPRRDTFLSFDKGDDIDILISVDPECWEVSCCTI